MAQSNFENVQLIEVIEQAINDIRGNVDATVGSVDNGLVTLVGDFTSIKFHENSANNLDKHLDITKDATTNRFRSCKLIDNGNVQFEASTSLSLIVGDIVNVVEASPFFFEGTPKTINIIKKSMPAIVLINAQDETITFSGIGRTLDNFYNIQLLFIDRSDDYTQGTGTKRSANDGFVNEHYTNYIRKPLFYYVKELMAKLNRYQYTENGANAIVDIVEQSVSASFQEAMGIQFNGASILSENENISGWVVRLKLSISNVACV